MRIAALLIALTTVFLPARLAADEVCRLFAPHSCRPVIKPRSVKRVMPAYPREALRRRIEGTVKVTVSIDRHGNIVSAEAETSRPFIGGAALAAVRSWRFVPMMLAGRATESEITIDFNFRLGEGGFGCATHITTSDGQC
jgi:TonB family protein